MGPRGDAEVMRTHAAELVALGPDIILAHSSAANRRTILRVIGVRDGAVVERCKG